MATKKGKMTHPVIPQKSVFKTTDEIKEGIVTACKIMDKWGLTEGLGHVSSRIPGTDHFVVTPRKGPGQVEKKEDLMIIDFDGNLIEGKGIPFGERSLHLEIYRTRPDVGAICSFWSEATTVLGALNRPVRPIIGPHYVLGYEVPIFNEARLHSNREVSERMAEVLGDAYGIILRGSGVATVGTNIIDACVRAVYLEQAAIYQYKASLLGEPIFLSLDEMDKWNEQYWRSTDYDLYLRFWDYFKSKL